MVSYYKKRKIHSVRNTTISLEKIFPVYNSSVLIAVARILISYLGNCFPETGYCIYIFIIHAIIFKYNVYLFYFFRQIPEPSPQ